MNKLNDSEKKRVFDLAQELTGSCQEGNFKKEILINNVCRIMSEAGYHNIAQYLDFALQDSKQKELLISALTIHTTSWFREKPHFDLLESIATEFYQKHNSKKVFKFWTAANSTGEELYTAGLVLEYVRSLYNGFEYELHGTDIDKVSLQKAYKAIYEDNVLKSIPKKYQKFVLLGSGKTKGLLTINKDIRKRARFFQVDLSKHPYVLPHASYDFIMCRNVLIYFKPVDVKGIVNRLMSKVDTNGVLCLGHSETQEKVPSNFKSVATAAYQKCVYNEEKIQIVKQVQPKVLIVDDSAVIRKVLKTILNNSNILTDEAANATIASDKISKNKYDLVTLDLHMPGESGPEWLQRVRKEGLTTPVIIVTDAAASEVEEVMNVLTDGAQDYLIKSTLNKNPLELVEKIKGLIKVSNPIDLNLNSNLKNKVDLKLYYPELILVGASTGGPQALTECLEKLPRENCPPVVVVQHINEAFAKPLAQRLATAASLDLVEPKEGIPLLPGKLYMAHGNYHLGIQKNSDRYTVQISESEKLHGHRPAVDYLFSSAAATKVHAINVLLTGMGRDGAKGMLELYQNTNSINLAQDEKSSVVYGMPKEAVSLGAVHFQGNLKEIRSVIDQALSIRTIKKAA